MIPHLPSIRPREAKQDRLTRTLRAGHFKEAMEFLKDVEMRGNPANQALLAELQMRTGEIDIARVSAQRLLLRPDLNRLAQVRCHLVLGTISRDSGQLDDARSHYQRALDLAELDKNLEHVCLAQMRLLSLHVAGCELEAATVTLPILKRNVQATGDPLLAIALHICLAEAETRRGLFDGAKRQLAAAELLLKETPNVFLEGNAAIAGLCLSLLSSAWEDASRQGLLALKCARHSGNVRTALAARLNLGQLFLTQGHLDEAERHLNEALSICPKGGDNEIGVLDALAHIFLERGNVGRCEEVLLRIDSILERNKLPVAYNRYWGIRTKLLLLKRLGRWEDAEELVTKIGQSIPTPSDSSLRAWLTLAKAEIFLMTGKLEAAQAILLEAMTQLDSMTLENQGQLERLLGLSAARTRPGDAATHFERACRIFRATQNRSGCADAVNEYALFLTDQSFTKILKEESVDSKPATTVLSRIAALHRFSSNPWLLGIEAFWLFAEMGCAAGIALIKNEGRNSQTVLSLPAGSQDVNWQRDNSRSISIELGNGTPWKLLVRPEQNQELSTMCLTIAKLVQSCVAFGISRTELRERTTSLSLTGEMDDAAGVFESETIREIIKTAKKIASTRIPILITGETGTGKEVLARFIHRQSSYSRKPFVAFNCATVPRELLDSQLFGHRRGAFTGAHEDFPGLIRSAEGGTLFLDEIGDLSRDSQPKLLRFLESGEIYPLGDVHPVKVDLHIMAATNLALDQLVANGQFREDLFYRLNAIRYEIPPLRERREEIPVLVSYFLKNFSEEFRKGHIEIADGTLDYLLLFSWPGNVRQLANEMRRAVALADVDDILQPDHLSREIVTARRTTETPMIRPSSGQLLVKLDQPLPSATKQLELAMLEHALRATHGRVESAAKLLGLSRKGLYLKRHRLGLETSHGS